MSRTPTYKTWLHMRERCSDPANVGFPRYGGRGIRVCERWAKFENFLADMGEAPRGHTLERRDNDGHYQPDNCEWATRTIQANNRRSSVHLTFNGRTMTIAQWGRELGISQLLLAKRYRAGWPIEHILDIKRRVNQYG